MEQFWLKIVFTILFSGSTMVNAQISDWLESFNNSSSINDLATDNQGFVYAVGTVNGDSTRWAYHDSISVKGTAYVAANIPKNYMTSYLVKIDSMGNVRWARFMGSPYGYGLHPTPIHVSVDRKGDIIMDVRYLDSLQIEKDDSIEIDI